MSEREYVRSISPNNPHVKYYSSERHRSNCRICDGSQHRMYGPFIYMGKVAAKRMRNSFQTKGE